MASKAYTHRTTEDIDAVIVGSGAGGAMAAYVLTKAGLRCVLLEAGRSYDAVAETNMFGTADSAPLRGSATPDKPMGFFDATVDGGWQVPGEPYTVADGNKFGWWRARMLGGRTNHWARHVPRFGPYDFKPFSRDGLGVDWPLSYDDIAPFYDRVEALIGVCGGRLGLENHPDSPPGTLHPAPKPRITEMLVAAAAKDLGIPCVPTHTAILTRDMPDKDAPRSACFNATDCGRGCSIGAAFQTTTSLLPMALATGRLRIVTRAMATRVVLRSASIAKGVEYVDAVTNEKHQVRARSVVLAASAGETARLLLNSKTESSPNGLANASGQVGRNIMDTVGCHVEAQIPGLAGRPIYNEFGINFPHLYIPWWLYKEQAQGKLDFPRGYHFEIGGRFDAPDFGRTTRDLPNVYGKPLQDAVKRSLGTTLHLSMRGEMVPNANCFAELDSKVVDKFGLPVLKFHWKWSNFEINQVRHGLETSRAIFRRMGGIVHDEDLTAEQAIATGGSLIHEAGTARMGADPRTSVVDKYNASWAIPNLVLTDGSVFASNPHKNLTLTILALSMRASERLAAKLKSSAFA